MNELLEQVLIGNVPVVPMSQPVEQAVEKKAGSPKLDMVVGWLRNHPESLTLTDRALAERLGVSHPIARKGKGIVRKD